MSSVVQHGSIEVQSNTESAEEMVKALTKPDDDGKRVIKPIKDRGKDVPEKDEKPAISTSEAGKRGAEAAAKARAEKEKQDAKADDASKDKREAAAEKPKKDAEAEDQKESAAGEGSQRVAGADDDRDSRTSAQARIRELARERTEARREAEKARQEAEEARQELQRARGGAQPAQQRQDAPAGQDDDPEPDPLKYTDGLQFTRDSAAWAARQEFARMERERNLAQHRAAQQKYVEEQKQAFVGKFEAAKAEDPEIVDKIDPDLLDLLHTTPAGMGASPSSALADEVFASDRPAQLLAYFTENPAEVRRLLALPNPRQMARAVALLESRFDKAPMAEEAEPDKPAVKLPQPLKPVGGSAQPGNVEAELNRDMPFDEYHRKRARWK